MYSTEFGWLLLLRVFHTSVNRWFFTRVWVTTSLRKSLQVSSTLLRTWAYLSNAVVLMVSTRPIIFNIPVSLSTLWWLYQAQIGITVLLTFHSFFFSSLAWTGPLSLLFAFSQFYPEVAGTAKSTIRQFFWGFFLEGVLSTIIRSGRLAEIRLSICISKSQISSCVSFFRTDSGLCIYHLLVWSNLNFLHNSQQMTFPTESCLVLNTFCDNLIHIIMFYSLSDSKSSQVSRTLRSILIDLNTTVVWMVSTRPFIFKSSCTCTNSLVTVPRAPIPIGITVTFMFNSFFNSRARFWYLYFISLSLLLFYSLRVSRVCVSW